MIITEPLIIDEDDIFDEDGQKELFLASDKSDQLLFLTNQLQDSVIEDYLDKVYEKIINNIT